MNMRSIVVLLALIAIVGSSATTTPVNANTFNAYRMLQFEKGDQKFGPQRSTLNAPAIRYNTAHPLTDYKSMVVVCRDTEFSAALLQSLVANDVAGVVVVVGSSVSNTAASATTMEALSSLAIPMPVYFVKDGEFDSSYLDSDYRLVVTSAAPAPVTPAPAINNLHGILRGNATLGYSSPTILVVAHYDSSSIAPGLAPTGNDANISGMVALLELSRVFSKLYSSPANQGTHNIMFLATGGSSSNFEGTRRWLESQPSHIVDAIDFVLCLDAMGQATPLYLHSSRPITKDDATRALYTAFQSSADANNVPFDLVQRKINIKNPVVFWEHEVFGRKHIASLTISSRATPSSDAAAPTVAAIKRNIKVVARALLARIYNNERISSDILSGSLDINEHFIESWINSLASTPRVYPFADVAPAAGSTDAPLVSHLVGIERAMKSYLNEVGKDTLKAETPATTTFYNPSVVSMSFYHVKPFTFDILFLLCSMLYLVAIYVLLKGKSAITEITELFTSMVSKTKTK
eukprot:gene8059-9469_t